MFAFLSAVFLTLYNYLLSAASYVNTVVGKCNGWRNVSYLSEMRK